MARNHRIHSDGRPLRGRFFGLAWLMEPPEEPEPPQAAEYRALLDAQRQEREFNEWRESQSRHIGQQLAAIVAADKGESE